MKRKILLLLTAALFCAASATAQGGTTGPLTWQISNDTLYIRGEGAMPDYSVMGAGLPIPWQLDYYIKFNTVIIENGVTKIGTYAFFGFTEITSITIPNSVITIGENSFAYCTGLTSVTIPNSVDTIGNGAFGGCNALTSVSIGNSVRYLSGFSGCGNLTSVTIPNSVITIGDNAFSACFGLKSINIPNYVTTIGNNAFYECYELSTVTIGNSVITIGDCAFRGCHHLDSIIIPNSVTTIGDRAFAGCLSLFSVTIPYSVTFIGIFAFSGCSSLETICVESENKNYYSENGVLFCKDKTTLIRCPGGKKGDYIIPNFVTTIGKCAFSNCYELTSVTIGDFVTTIEEFAFESCGMTSVTIGNSVTTIDVCAFQCCHFLTTVSIGNSVTKVKSCAFQGCNGLESVLFGKSVLIIENHAFLNCTGIKTIDFPNSLDSISPSAFDNCAGLTSINFGNSVRFLSGFGNCTSLASVTIPKSVTTIGRDAFILCPLTSITIPNSVIRIEGNAFAGCPLTSISIPNSVQYLSGFAGTGLSSIEIPNSVTTIGVGAFCRTGLVSVIIPNSVTKIENAAFAECASLVSIIIPNSVTKIENNAFTDCTNLVSIIIPNSVTKIEQNTFQRCYGLKSVLIPNSVTTIGYSAFNQCTSLDSIFVPNSVTTIDSWSFNFCEGLKSLIIGNSIVGINQNAFRGCVNLESITIYANYPPFITEAFEYVSKNIPIYVPCKSLDKYKNAPGWDQFTNFSCIVYPDPQICMVSVNDNNHNQLVWEKQDGFVAYNIYREIMQSGKFERVATISSSSVWLDTGSNAKARSYSYKINGVYSNLTVSEFSNIHRTMYLSVYSGANNSKNLIWTSYEGVEYDSCYIYRAVTPGEWQLIHTVSAENNSYTDYSTPAGTLYYRIEISPVSSCFSGNIKSNIASNIDEIPKYSVFVNANNPAFGSVSGAGTYKRDTTATVSATENCGYRFVNWTKWGEIVSTESTYTFTVTEDVELVANFEAVEWNPTLNFNSYVITKFNNTFMLNLNKLAAHGYTPTHCKWFENGELIGEGFTYSVGNNINDLLKEGAVYTFMLCTGNTPVFSTEKKHGGNQSTVQVSPNPTTGQLTIELRQAQLPNGELTTAAPVGANSAKLIKSVEVFDVFGRNLIPQTSNLKPQTSIDISDLPSGIYFLKITTEQEIITKKIIKQ